MATPPTLAPYEIAFTMRRRFMEESTVYSVTAAGRARFAEPLVVLIAQPATEYPLFKVGLCFMHHLDAGASAGLRRRREAALRDRLDHKRALLEQLLAEGLTRLSLIEEEHSLVTLESELAWVRGLIEEITDGRLEWMAGYRQAVGEEGRR